jgi:hypothetical protein
MADGANGPGAASVGMFNDNDSSPGDNEKSPLGVGVRQDALDDGAEEGEP